MELILLNKRSALYTFIRTGLLKDTVRYMNMDITIMDALSQLINH